MNINGKKTRVVLTNLLTAVAICMIVNFSQYITVLSSSISQQAQQNLRAFRQAPMDFIIIQTLFYILLAFILLSIVTTKTQGEKGSKNFGFKVLICLAVTFAAFMLAPRLMMRSGRIILNFNANRIVDNLLILRCSFTLIAAVLFGKIFELIYQRQNIIIENEVLKNENLQSTYNSLVNQINPHFFFNSLNSLAMLVREKHNEQALDYIDRLSDTFRYIIQSGQTEITTLAEELKFLDSYAYMLEIRYEGKLFFDKKIDPDYSTWSLPSLSLQPLIENAVKHNSITKTNPLTITISTQGDNLVVSNHMKPKIVKEPGTGIGLNNLAARYQLITSKSITVRKDNGIFEVVLPLIHPKS